MPTTISSATLRTDAESLIALAALTDYDPRNPAYALASLQSAKTTLDTTEVRLLRARAELAAAVDAHNAAARAFHGLVVGARDEVKVQFGENSDAYASIGRKKKSERKRPVRRSAPNTLDAAPLLRAA